MTDPKPISLTQVAEDAYAGEKPQPMLVVGPIPGGGGGGGPVAISDVTGLQSELAAKATNAQLAQLEESATAALDGLSDVVAGKASTTDVTAALSGKASTADLDNVFGIATEARDALGGLKFVKVTAAALPPEAQRPADTVYVVVG